MESSTAYASGVGGKKSDAGSTVLKEEIVDPIFSPLFSFIFFLFVVYRSMAIKDGCVVGMNVDAS